MNPLVYYPIAAIAYLLFRMYYKKTKGNSLGIIGMKGAGKTTFYNKLGLLGNDGGGTYKTPYNQRNIKIGDRDIKIASGEDIGGGENFISDQTYEKWFSEKDIIIFIFDISKYCQNENYSDQTNARLSYIYNRFKAKKKTDFENVVIVASHADQFKITYKEFRNILGEKEYNKLFENNFFLADLTDDKSFNSIIKTIF